MVYMVLYYIAVILSNTFHLVFLLCCTILLAVQPPTFYDDLYLVIVNRSCSTFTIDWVTHFFNIDDWVFLWEDFSSSKPGCVCLTDKYKERHQTCLENNHATMQAQYQQGQEKTKFYFEKHQQLKAKKSSKRQRDSSSGGSVSNRLYFTVCLSVCLPSSIECLTPTR